ncbi:hypothetical protein GDO81_025076 [Engystomops pustulosus]|uniref:Uncharacterized protein n=1 Tax=Engystomops pustulosus TaxID=76066 RepID=A0AAV6YN40_ENGPU|nr:hypothetical protein GDO81_025076 [Engystomops pustulosus]
MVSNSCPNRYSPWNGRPHSLDFDLKSPVHCLSHSVLLAELESAPSLALNLTPSAEASATKAAADLSTGIVSKRISLGVPSLM